MINLITSKARYILILMIFAGYLSGCSKLNKVKELTEKVTDEVKADKLYFCERYDAVKGEVNEAKKFSTGTLTVMVKLSKPIGVREVNINITDLNTGKAVETLPFTVQSSWDYIHFDDVIFDKAGKYKVSCLKKDGTVLATGEIEII
ncbi:MAG: hypothetical protein EHM58_12395 [Ignavibacteriae bacterium]|nr:MAG: hypothetical protein EHM58_12395 [Ignavibacteriota bacterium]